MCPQCDAPTPSPIFQGLGVTLDRGILCRRRSVPSFSALSPLFSFPLSPHRRWQDRPFERRQRSCADLYIRRLSTSCNRHQPPSACRTTVSSIAHCNWHLAQTDNRRPLSTAAESTPVSAQTTERCVRLVSACWAGSVGPAGLIKRSRSGHRF